MSHLGKHKTIILTIAITIAEDISYKIGGNMSGENYDPKTLVDIGVSIVRQVRKNIMLTLRDDMRRVSSLTKVTTIIGDDIENKKSALDIDRYAESLCINEFAAKCQETLFVLGEESLTRFSESDDIRDFNEHAQRCVLVDMIDGTDLLEMNIPLWCSAVVIFDPYIPKILGAIVGQASGELYFASCDDDCAYVSRTPNDDINIFPQKSKLKGPSIITELNKATISFYGQKAKNLLSVGQVLKFRNKLEHIQSQKDADFRVLTIAGNPFMVKLVDREKTKKGAIVSRGIDVVFDINGQHLHDVVPGLFIALKSGAFALDLEGNQITYESLAKLLITPGKKMKYILSATEQLGRELLHVLTDD